MPSRVAHRRSRCRMAVGGATEIRPPGREASRRRIEGERFAEAFGDGWSSRCDLAEERVSCLHEGTAEIAGVDGSSTRAATPSPCAISASRRCSVPTSARSRRRRSACPTRPHPPGSSNSPEVGIPFPGGGAPIWRCITRGSVRPCVPPHGARWTAPKRRLGGCGLDGVVLCSCCVAV
jgi:hypothetical protein